MHALMEQYLEWMQVQNFSEDTVTRAAPTSATSSTGAASAASATRRGHAARCSNAISAGSTTTARRTAQPLSFRTQHTRLRAAQGLVPVDGAAELSSCTIRPRELELPRLEHRLPKYVLTAEEAEQVIAAGRHPRRRGLRDRAILETFYSTGMRRMELANLKLYDLDAERGTVMIRQGKGKKDRMIPIGERALAWIDKYMRGGAPATADRSPTTARCS